MFTGDLTLLSQGGGLKVLLMAQKILNSSEMVSATNNRLTTFSIFLCKRLLENFVFLPFAILEIFVISQFGTSNSQ